MTWHCTRDHVTEPCGDCDGCRYALTLCSVERVSMTMVAYGPRFAPACGQPAVVHIDNGARVCTDHAAAMRRMAPNA